MFSGVSSTCSVLPRDVGACCLELTQACRPAPFQILHMGSEKTTDSQSNTGGGALEQCHAALIQRRKGPLVQWH